MRVKKISFLDVYEDSTAIESQYMDIYVELENGFRYIFEVATIKHMQYVMKNYKVSYDPPGLLILPVQKLTKEAIVDAVLTYAADKEDGYWIKLYHFSGSIPKTMFDELEVEARKSNESKESDEFLIKLYEMSDDSKNS